MDKEDFKILMYALYGNKQLIIPDGQTLKEWIDNAFVEKQKEAIDYTHCCTEFFCEDEGLEYSSKKCKEQCSGCKWIESLQQNNYLQLKSV